MNDEQMEVLFFQLYNAKNEVEIESIISKDIILSNNKNWQPYGGNQNNFGTFENQQNNPVPALVEKITNSIDACLIKKCEEKCIDPKSSEAPQNMYQAVEQFFGIKDCNINDLTNNERRSIAENIQIIATGDKDQPNIRIYDNGEGQLPEKFKDTLLSLHKGNKIKIAFAQGKYNMGSTGAVVFCGDKKFHLIGSKRANNSEAKFGFTLVRRHQLTVAEKEQNYRSTWYEYLTIEGMIPSFYIDKLDLQLKNRVFETGTIIQLYSFQLPHGNKGDISTDLYRSFNHYFYDLPLPFLVYETRYGSDINNKVIKGNRNRIDDDRHNNIDKTISLELQTNLDASNEYFKIPVNITVFKEQPNNEQNRQFIGNKNLIFTLNGQLHGFEGQTFISKDLGFPLLKTTTLVAINCNHLPVDVMQELFMSNRTHLKQGNLTEKLREEVISIIKQEGTLKKINQQRKESLIGKSNNNDFSDVIGLLPKNSEIFDFLKKDSHLPFSKVTNKTKSGSDKTSSKSQCTQLQRFPSHFKIKLKENDEGRRLKGIPLNQSGHVDIKTDVENDYLFRSSDAGELNIEILQKIRVGDEKATSNGKVESDAVQRIKVNRSGPSDGNIRLNINPTEDAKVGDEIEVSVSLTSPSETFTCQFHVRIDENITPPKDRLEKPSNQYPDPPAARKAYETPKNNNNDLAWDNEQLSWSGSDIVKIISGGDESKLLVEAIVVNMDSYVLKEFINKNKYTEEKDIQRISTKYFQLIYTHSLGLYSICTKMQNETTDSENKNEVFDIQQVDDFISRVIKSYSSFLLYIDLHNEDIMKKMTDED